MTTLGKLVVLVIILIPIIVVGVYLATRPEAAPVSEQTVPVNNSLEGVAETPKMETGEPESATTTGENPGEAEGLAGTASSTGEMASSTTPLP